MHLYVVHRCPFGHRAAIALREKQLAFELSFFQPNQRPAELDAIGPRAKSPTLFDGDAKIYDSQVVLEYLEDRYPERALLPESAAGRADVRMLLTRYNDEIAPKFGTLIGELLFKQPRDEAKIADAKLAFLKSLVPLDAYLEGRTFAVGDALTLADITMYTFLPAAESIAEISIPAELTHLAAWYERMRARPTTTLPAPS